MLRCYNYDIVCSEIPDEVTLAINISGCPFRCEGCHSPWLQSDEGAEMTAEWLAELVGRYSSAVTCVCFMGGDHEPSEVAALASNVRRSCPHLKTGWYSGSETVPDKIDKSIFDYIKTGAYVESLGGLRSPRTNQRLYRLSHGEIVATVTFGR